MAKSPYCIFVLYEIQIDSAVYKEITFGPKYSDIQRNSNYIILIVYYCIIEPAERGVPPPPKRYF